MAKQDTRPFVLPSDPVLDAKKGKPSKNPRYLQLRLDKEDPLSTYLAEVGERLHLRTPEGTPILSPVTDLLPGQRLSPTDVERGTRTLAVFGPIHHLETPELFMKVIASLTVKSPLTTGAGSEGALTKGPFNALLPIHYFNDRLTTLILTGEHAFVTATGSLGPRHTVDHDISLIVPELWSGCRPKSEALGTLSTTDFWSV